MERMADKISIVGMGNVGSSLAYAITLLGLTGELVLVDENSEKALGEALDLRDSVAFGKKVKVEAGAYQDCRGSDIIIFSAGVNRRPGENQTDLLGRNLSLLEKCLSGVGPYQGKTILLLISNPVEVMTCAALKLSGWPKEKVIGLGTVLETSRFRSILGGHFKIAANNITAYVGGMHGAFAVPLWSAVNIAGVGLEQFCRMRNISGLDRKEIYDRTLIDAYDVVFHKGASYFANSSAAVRVCRSILRDENDVLTVCGAMDKFPGLEEVCLSFPSRLGRKGRKEALPLSLSAEETKALQRAAEAVRNLLKSVSL